MSTSKQTLVEWFFEGWSSGYSHMIVVCDTFSYEDYPVYVKHSEDVRERFSQFNGKNMQRVMEVYDLSMDRDFQMSEARAFHF